MASSLLTPEKAQRMENQAQEFIALEALIVQNRRLGMTPIVDDDYPGVREQWEHALHVFLRAAMKNRPDQMRSVVGRSIDPAESKLALELVRMGVAPVSFEETTCQAALRALKDKPDGFLAQTDPGALAYQTRPSGEA